MKNLLVLATLTFASASFAADVTQIKNGDTGIRQARATLISVAPICPANPGGVTCMAVGSTVKVKVSLGGCLDRMGGYFSRFEKKNGKPVLYFGALTIANKASLTARCYAAPEEIVTVYVEENLNSIKFEKLNFTGTAYSK